MPLLVLLCGAALSLGAWWTLARARQAADERHLEADLRVHHERLLRDAEHLMMVASSFQGLYLASQEVSGREFAAHFDILRIQATMPEVLAVRYEPVLPVDPGRPGRRYGPALHERPAGLQALPGTPDEATEAPARQVARDLDLVRLEPPAARPDGRVLLHVEAPVYGGGEGDPGTPELRRRLHVGRVHVVADAQRLLGFRPLPSPAGADLLRLDDLGPAGTPPQAPQRLAQAGEAVGARRLLGEKMIEVGQRRWRLGLERGLAPAGLAGAPLLAGLAGLLLTLVAARLVQRLQQRADRSEAECRRLGEIGQHAAATMQRIARHDALTGLPNREAFQEHLAERLGCWAGPDEQSGLLALLLLDLDRFQTINATLGLEAGDQVLLQVGERLREQGGGRALIARLGGDEFALLLEGLPDEASVEALAQQLLHALSQPLQVDGHALRPGASIGIACIASGAPAAALDDPALMTRADAALHQAKRDGGAQHRMHRAAAPSAEDADLLQLEADLHHALARGELELHFQPQFDARTLSVVGAEALLRWRHPVHGMVRPDRFIPLAEASGLIVPIGRWVLDEACRQAQQWSALAGREIDVAVNVSARQMIDDHLPGEVAEALRRHGLAPRRLELEITEGIAVRDVDQARGLLERLHALGVGVAIDDFGVGHSSLAYLRDLPVRRFKIDRGFLRGVPADAGGARLVAAMVSMARGLEVGVVAEGVERIEQLDFLVEQGCEVVQGFLLGRPLPADDFLHRLLDDAFGHRGRS